jgi:hypothetical protein
MAQAAIWEVIFPCFLTRTLAPPRFTGGSKLLPPPRRSSASCDASLPPRLNAALPRRQATQLQRRPCCSNRNYAPELLVQARSALDCLCGWAPSTGSQPQLCLPSRQWSRLEFAVVAAQPNPTRSRLRLSGRAADRRLQRWLPAWGFYSSWQWSLWPAHGRWQQPINSIPPSFRTLRGQEGVRTLPLLSPSAGQWGRPPRCGAPMRDSCR